MRENAPENAREAWSEVGERVSSWGRRLSGHYRQAGGAGNEIGRAFTAFGETINDDDAKKDLRRAVSSIGDAVTVTVSEAGKAVRGRSATGEQPQRPDRDAGEGSPSA